MTPATVLRGTRRVGKTILLQQIIEQLLKNGVAGNRILYVTFDELPTLRGIQEPVLAISRWFETEILKKTFNAAARDNQRAYILLDEVQNLDDWAPQVKHLVDNHAVRMGITGSSSLRIEAGRDSLAGRILTLEIGPLSLREIAQFKGFSLSESLWGDNGLHKLATPDFWREAVDIGNRDSEIRHKSFQLFSRRGGYPIAHEKEDPMPELMGYLNESIIRRAIQHDLRMGERGKKRDEKLLEEVYRLCCRYAGQIVGQKVFSSEIQHALAGNIGWTRILTYLKFLDKTLLIHLVEPMELRLKKKKNLSKICLSDHILRESWFGENIPLDPADLAGNPHATDLAGHIAESALGYFLSGPLGSSLSYFPQRDNEPEVDFVLTMGEKRIPIEVKYRKRIDPFEDTRGLRSFLEKTVYNAPFALLVTLEDNVQIPDPRIIPISLSSLLWSR